MSEYLEGRTTVDFYYYGNRSPEIIQLVGGNHSDGLVPNTPISKVTVGVINSAHPDNGRRYLMTFRFFKVLSIV